MIVDGDPADMEEMLRICAASNMIDVVGSAADGTSLLKLIGSVRPQAVFIDGAVQVLKSVSPRHARSARSLMLTTRRPAVLLSVEVT